MFILTMLILFIAEHGRSFQLLTSSLISFCKVWKFLSYMSFTCLVRVPQYILYYLRLWKGFDSVIFFLSPFITCIQEGYSFVLFCFAFFLSYFLSSYLIKCVYRLQEFLARVLGSLMNTFISFLNNDTLTSSFLIHIPLVSFSFSFSSNQKINTLYKGMERLNNIDLLLILMVLLCVSLHLI